MGLNLLHQNTEVGRIRPELAQPAFCHCTRDYKNNSLFTVLEKLPRIEYLNLLPTASSFSLKWFDKKYISTLN